MKKKLLVLFIVCVFINVCFYGCTKKDVDPNKVVQSLKDLSSYTCDLDINIKNPNQEVKLECKQFYDKQLGRRLDLNGERRFIYRKDDVLVNDLKNNRQYTLDKNFDSVYKLSFLKEYIDLLYTNQNIKHEFKTFNNKNYQLISLTIPGNNRNIHSAVMYVNRDEGIPEKTVVCDIKGNEVVSFIYKNFVPNPKLEKSIFVK